jgi:hypothetical protein
MYRPRLYCTGTKCKGTYKYPRVLLSSPVDLSRPEPEKKKATIGYSGCCHLDLTPSMAGLPLIGPAVWDTFCTCMSPFFATGGPYLTVLPRLIFSSRSPSWDAADFESGWHKLNLPSEFHYLIGSWKWADLLHKVKKQLEIKNRVCGTRKVRKRTAAQGWMIQHVVCSEHGYATLPLTTSNLYI